MGAVVREKEVALRATKEENEVLSFNNERLTKRVTILQKSMNEEVRRGFVCLVTYPSPKMEVQEAGLAGAKLRKLQR